MWQDMSTILIDYTCVQAMQRDYKLSSYSLNSVSSHFLGEQVNLNSSASLQISFIHVLTLWMMISFPLKHQWAHTPCWMFVLLGAEGRCSPLYHIRPTEWQPWNPPKAGCLLPEGASSCNWLWIYFWMSLLFPCGWTLVSRFSHYLLHA